MYRGHMIRIVLMTEPLRKSLKKTENVNGRRDFPGTSVFNS